MACASMKGHEVQRIIHAKYDDYGDQIVKMVQGLPEDCRQSGDDSVLEDVWEEFKYQVQQDESAMFGAYEDTITALCQKLVENVPNHELELLWLASDGYFNQDEEGVQLEKVEDVVNELYRRICNRAFDEDLKNDPDEEGGSDGD